MGVEGFKYSVKDRPGDLGQAAAKEATGPSVFSTVRQAPGIYHSTGREREAIRDSVTNTPLGAGSSGYILYDLWQRSAAGKTSTPFRAVVAHRMM